MAKKDKDKASKRTAEAGTQGTERDPREELREELQMMGKAASELMEHLVRVPATLAQLPLQAFPEETATHARNAANEGFAAVRSLIDSMSRGIDEMIKTQRERSAQGKKGSSASSTGGMEDLGGSTRSLESGSASGYQGGKGTGAGPMGGPADSASRDLGGDGGGGNPTIRLDESP
jgi:hypothetical protein